LERVAAIKRLFNEVRGPLLFVRRRAGRSIPSVARDRVSAPVRPEDSRAEVVSNPRLSKRPPVRLEDALGCRTGPPSVGDLRRLKPPLMSAKLAKSWRLDGTIG